MLGFPVGIKEVLSSGGPVFIFLVLLSIFSLAVIWERWRFFRDGTSNYQQFLTRIRQAIGGGKTADALQIARGHKGLAGPVLVTALTVEGSYEERNRAAERTIERQAAKLERGLTVLGTLGSVAPFVGLFGTVVGVIRAFKGLSGVGDAGPGALAVGIAEALVTTAMGLVVAIPAVVAYNFFNSWMREFTDELGRTSEEVLDVRDSTEPRGSRKLSRAEEN